MSHRPLYKWKLDKEGRPLLDDKGNRVPHPKEGQPKTDKDLTEAERESIERQKGHYDSLQRIEAQREVDRQDRARAIIGRQ